MRTSVSNIAWLPEERLHAYDLLANSGVTGLEIAPKLFFHAAEDPFEPEQDIAAMALAEIADVGLTLVSMQSLLFGVPGAFLFGDERAREMFETSMTRAIYLAGRLEIPNLVFGSPKQRRVPTDITMPRALDEATEVFHRLGDVAKSVGTKIAIEPNPEVYGTNFLTTMADATSFVRRVGHPAIVGILDLGALSSNGGVERTLDIIREDIACLNHVHVSEPNLAPAPADPASLAPILRALENYGYDKVISIEMTRPSEGLVEIDKSIGRLLKAFCVQEGGNV